LPDAAVSSRAGAHPLHATPAYRALAAAAGQLAGEACVFAHSVLTEGQLLAAAGQLPGSQEQLGVAVGDGWAWRVHGDVLLRCVQEPQQMLQRLQGRRQGQQEGWQGQQQREGEGQALKSAQGQGQAVAGAKRVRGNGSSDEGGGGQRQQRARQPEQKQHQPQQRRQHQPQQQRNRDDSEAIVIDSSDSADDFV
jgi:hypothetical protein